MIWIGTDDGRIQQTRTAASTGHNVTPKGLPIWSKVASLDLSPLDAGTAYAAVNRHRQGDFTPHVWRTHDDGKHWTEVSNGLPGDQFVTVVRADPKRAGLLYAGHQPRRLRLLRRRRALAAAAAQPADGLGARPAGARQRPDRGHAGQGDLGARRPDAPASGQCRHGGRAGAPVHAGRGLARARRREQGHPVAAGNPAGKNPPAGAIIDYHLAHAANGAVTLAIHDARRPPGATLFQPGQARAPGCLPLLPQGLAAPGRAAVGQGRAASLRVGPALLAAAGHQVRLFHRRDLGFGHAGHAGGAAGPAGHAIAWCCTWTARPTGRR